MAIPKREDGDFIEGIYHWCDRWCERCELATKCRQYAMECTRDAFNADGSSDGDSAEFVESLMCVTGEFEDQAENGTRPEFESSFEEPEGDSIEDFDEFDMDSYMVERERIEKATGETPCVKLADRYLNEGSRWLDEWEILTDQLTETDPDTEDAIEIIGWYLFQHSVKLRRAIGTKIEGEFEDLEDVYGSAKVVLIGADRSLEAWRRLQSKLPKESRGSIDPILLILHDMIKSTEAEIPEARSFKRPGFDD